jgi:hypothetical protein
MDTERLVAYLINGVLLDILWRGRIKHSIAWIVPDDATRWGFSLHFDKIPSTLDKPIGGKLTPHEATDGSKVIEDRKKLVAKYLVESFGLTTEQAERVITEAHHWQRQLNWG